MDYVPPNTEVRLLQFTGLDRGYKHTYCFDTISRQTDFFMNHTIPNKGVTDSYGNTAAIFSKQYYQRVTKNSLRLQAQADYLRTADYMMFQNTAFSNKWFYAFVTKVEYVSNEVALIEYELDHMQTWLFSFTVDTSFVEREHTSDDVFGKYTLPENLELGQYLSTPIDIPDADNPMKPLRIVVAAPFNDQYEPITGTSYAGTYSGLMFHSFPHTIQGAIDCTNFINGAAAQATGIVSIFLMPEKFITAANANPVTIVHYIQSQIPPTKNSFIGISLDGQYTLEYVPHNKKLFTYPYNFLQITNKQGGTLDLRYELFNNIASSPGAPNTQGFRFICDCSPNPTAIVAPLGYAKSVDFSEYSLPLTNFPQLPFTVDTYKAHLAMATSDMLTNLGVGAVDTAIGFAFDPVLGTKNMLETVEEGINASTEIMIRGAIRQTNPTLTQPNRTQTGRNAVTFAYYGQIGFNFINKHITPEYARIIDKYFDMYGYQLNQVKRITDLMNGRPTWCYHKTIGCSISGRVPTVSHDVICNAFDNGITFWRWDATNQASIHDYNQPNQV